MARDGEGCRRAEDQRGYRAGHAAGEMGSRQVPGHDLAPCSHGNGGARRWFLARSLIAAASS